MSVTPILRCNDVRVSVRVSIVIPVYRDADALARTLNTIDFGDAEVIVAGAAGDE